MLAIGRELEKGDKFYCIEQCPFRRPCLKLLRDLGINIFTTLENVPFRRKFRCIQEQRIDLGIRVGENQMVQRGFL